MKNGDGNCLFRAINRLTYGTPDYHKLIKETVCDYIASRYDRFSDFILGDIYDYIGQMLDEGTWEESLKLSHFLNSLMQLLIFMKDSHHKLLIIDIL